VKRYWVNWDAQFKHFRHFPVLKYQGEALHYFAEGAYKVSLNSKSLHCSACSLGYNKVKNAGRNHWFSTLELQYEYWALGSPWSAPCETEALLVLLAKGCYCVWTEHV